MRKEITDFLIDMINFDRMLGASLLRVLYFIGLTLIGIYSLIMIFGGLNMPSGFGAGMILAGLLYLVLAPMFLRIICELAMAIFAINENLGQIKRGFDEQDRAA